jgi:predicted TIM-barrel fold metal-dependent hydrolase
VRPSPVWWAGPTDRAGRRQIAYDGRPVGRCPLQLHFGFDGWQAPTHDVPFEPSDDGTWVAEIPEVDGHVVIDCVIKAGDRCDNNDGADYRLWITTPPVDCHLHVRNAGSARMGLAALHTALASAGIANGLVSWQANSIVDRLVVNVPWLLPLVWVVPGRTPLRDVRRRLAAGHCGLKLHPSFDRFAADDPRLDPYLNLAREFRVPVAVHSAPGPSDPDLIRRLAERFPTVPVLLYHTYLGPPEGRRRAARHAQRLSNIYLETSWCSSDEVFRLLEEVGPDKVLFGSDAAVDGPRHFVHRPPNVEGRQTYNNALLSIARELDRDTVRQVFRDNTRRLFGLDG